MFENTLLIVVILILIAAAWIIGHNIGYARGADDASFQKENPCDEGSLHKVIDYQENPEGRSVKGVHYE